MTVAFVFPGQGSQSVGMLGAMAAQFPRIKETFHEASEALGYDLWALAAEGPAEEQALTEKTQPLILTASIALYRLWVAEGGSIPVLAAGHSLGEFSALVAAGTLSLTDAVALVQARGAAMQKAVPVGVGAMAAVLGADDDVIVAACAECSEVDSIVQAVNFNSPGQVVIAGHKTAVERITPILQELGARRVVPLPVSAPFHTSLMRPVSDVIAARLETISLAEPAFPVISNVTAQAQTNPANIRERLLEQVYSPVRWTECAQQIIGASPALVVECGPGAVLSGLMKRIAKQQPITTIETPDDLANALQSAITL